MDKETHITKKDIEDGLLPAIKEGMVTTKEMEDLETYADRLEREIEISKVIMGETERKEKE